MPARDVKLRKTDHRPASGLQAKLRVLETTDLHVNLMPYDYFTDRPAPAGSLTHVAGLVRHLRAEVDTCLLFDNGDFLQGNPLADRIAREGGFGPGDLHPMIAAMNLLGYDAGTLGNHEFDYGLDFLTDAIAAARFPLVSANTFRTSPAGPHPIVPPFVLLDRQVIAADGRAYPLRLGVIGFAPPTLTDWNRMVLRGRVATCDIVDAARSCLPQMQAAGVDLIVALCHAGIGAGAAVPQMEDAAVPLAALDGIDVILTGHTHLLFPDPNLPGPNLPSYAAIDPVRGSLHGKPAVMAGSGGSHVGVIDLTLEQRGGRWAIAHYVVRTEPVARLDSAGHVVPRYPPDPGVAAAAATGHADILALIRQPLGATAVPLHSYFALVAPDRTLQIVAEAQTAYARLHLQGTPWAGLPVLSAAAPSKAGGLGGPGNYVDIPPGPLLMRHAAELCVFPNTLCLLLIDGAGVRDWLEHAAGLFCQIIPGRTDQPLMDPDHPSYNFDVIAGLTYQIDPSQPRRTDGAGRVQSPAARRIHDLRLNGRPVGPADPVVIAANSYRVGGGGGFVMAQAARILHHSTQNLRDIVAEYLRSAVPVHPAPCRIWRFAPLPGTEAWFDSGPGALARLTDPGIVGSGPGANGMHRFVMTLDPLAAAKGSAMDDPVA